MIGGLRLTARVTTLVPRGPHNPFSRPWRDLMEWTSILTGILGVLSTAFFFLWRGSKAREKHVKVQSVATEKINDLSREIEEDEDKIEVFTGAILEKAIELETVTAEAQEMRDEVGNLFGDELDAAFQDALHGSSPTPGGDDYSDT